MRVDFSCYTERRKTGGEVVRVTDGEKRYQILRGRLYERLPVLALALGLLDWREAETIGTDGQFFYAPVSFLERARENRASAERTLLHSALHAMLGHVWERGNRTERTWDLACDMAAEFLACRMLGLTLEEDAAKAFYALKNGTAFSAPAICAQLDEKFPADRTALETLFARDCHDVWRKAAERARLPGSNGDGAGGAALWRRAKQKLAPYMREEKPKIGSGTAGAKLALPERAENNVRFANLLRAFSVTRENRHVNDADFSYSWYAYGMAHYDGAALVEPLEYSEERKLRELAIVLDTSASCSRGMTSWFLRAVHDILLRERLFFERFRLHILQCDCEVQHDALVTDLEEFQWYLDHLELYGGGGTDFRPAFRRIDELVASGEFARLGGVLYFTDGYGVFPEKAPDYHVAFVMLRYRYDDINIPRWAIKLILDAEKPGRDEGWI